MHSALVLANDNIDGNSRSGDAAARSRYAGSLHVLLQISEILSPPGPRTRFAQITFHFRAVAAQSSAGVVAARDEAPESVLGACAGYPSIFPIIPPSAGPVRRFLHTATAQDHRVSLPCQRVQRAHRHPHAPPACPGVGVGRQPVSPYYTRASRVPLAAVQAGKTALLGPAALLARTMSFVPPAKRHPHALPACPGVGVGRQPVSPYYTRASRVLLAAVRVELCASSNFLHVPHTNGALYFSGYALLPSAWCGVGTTAG